MIGAAKRKSISPPGLSALWTILLLVVALFLPETRVWGFAATPQPASGVFAPANPLSIGENYDGWQYDASDSSLAARGTPTGPTGQFYSTAFETRLSPTSYPGVSRGRHFQEANENLLRAMEGNAGLAQSMPVDRREVIF